MKKPHFPEPGAPERSPYREVSLPTEEVPEAPRGVVVSRPDPPDELDAADPLRGLSVAERRKHARALLAVDTAKNPKGFRARLLIVPATLALWRYDVFPRELRFLLYPLLAVALVVLVIEVRRRFQGTEP